MSDETEPRPADVALMLEQEIDKRIVTGLIRLLNPESKITAEQVLAMSSDEAGDVVYGLLQNMKSRKEKEAARKRDEMLAKMYANAATRPVLTGKSAMNVYHDQITNMFSKENSWATMFNQETQMVAGVPVESLTDTVKIKGTPGVRNLLKPSSALDAITKWIKK